VSNSLGLVQATLRKVNLEGQLESVEVCNDRAVALPTCGLVGQA
jgi:hypothetical protein